MYRSEITLKGNVSFPGLPKGTWVSSSGEGAWPCMSEGKGDGELSFPPVAFPEDHFSVPTVEEE